MRRKLLRRAVAMALASIMVLSSGLSVFAESFTLSWTILSSTYNKNYVFGNETVTSVDSIEKWTMAGKTAFCLESGRKVTGFTGEKEEKITVDYYAKKASTKNSLQSKIAYLGYYGASSQSNKNYAFTQMMLWQSLTGMELSGNKNIKFDKASTNSEYKTWKSKIQAKIDEWDTRPSFDNSTTGTVLSLKKGESKTVTDKNKALKYYDSFIYTLSGVTVSHNSGENTMTYRATSSAPTGSVTMSESDLKKAGGVKYDSNVKSNYVYHNDENQDMAVYGMTTPVGLDLIIKVSAPSIGTTAIDGETKEHIANAKEKVTLIDTVSYTNVISGKEYALQGKVMNKETGKPLVIDGKEVTASTKFTPSNTSGSIDVSFTFNGEDLKGSTVVIFESLYLDGKEVATHADINDEGQSVHFPSIETLAKDKSSDSQISNPKENVTIVDTVTYTNLIPGKEYKVKGVLMDKATEKPLLVNGEEVRGETTFVPENKDGMVDIEFILDASSLSGVTTVVFENLYFNNHEIASHMDISDTGQSIYFPNLKTDAKDSATNTHISNSDESVTIVDTVKYENLIPDKEYTVMGTIMDKATGEALTINGETVRGETTFVPTESSGETTVSFTFDGSALAGSVIVVFEDLYYDEKLVYAHADLEDEAQTIYFPQVETLAMRDGDVVTDHVAYYNLQPGDAYKVTGTLMDKDTGEPVMLDGEIVTATKEFTAETAQGEIEVEFNVDSKMLAGKTTVIFENVKYEDETVADHSDLNNENQTVAFPENPPAPENPMNPTSPEPTKIEKTVPYTGDNSSMYIAMWALLASAMCFGITMISKEKLEKKIDE